MPTDSNPIDPANSAAANEIGQDSTWRSAVALGRAAWPELLGWGLMVAAALLCRPLTPVDETRVVSVAWEMWLRGDFLVPYLNGEIYSHKPPLLQWLIQGSWLLFGVNELTPRLIPPLFAFANLLLVRAIARRLWPERAGIAETAPVALLGFGLWAVWSTVTLYDMLYTCFALWGLLSILNAAVGKRGAFVWVGIAIGAGLLSKGPIILLLILPAAVFAPWWLEQTPSGGWRGWYLGIVGSVLLGSALALCWAIPAGLRGGEEYRHAILWAQSAGRVANSFAHKRPLWWYALWSPLLFFPWALWPRLWRGVRGLQIDSGLRFCFILGGFVFVGLSLISAKQVHYLIPLFPIAALIVVRACITDAGESPERHWPVVESLLLLFGLAFVVLGSLPEELAPQADWMRITQAAPLPSRLLLIAAPLAALLWRSADAIASLRRCAYAVIVMLLAAHLVYRVAMGPQYDMHPFAERIAKLQEQNLPLAHLGDYDGDFHFVGRLRQPLTEISGTQLRDWVKAHPGGQVIARVRPSAESAVAAAVSSQAYRGSRILGLWSAHDLLEVPALRARLTE